MLKFIREFCDEKKLSEYVFICNKIEKLELVCSNGNIENSNVINLSKNLIIFRDNNRYYKIMTPDCAHGILSQVVENHKTETNFAWMNLQSDAKLLIEPDSSDRDFVCSVNPINTEIFTSRLSSLMEKYGVLAGQFLVTRHAAHRIGPQKQCSQAYCEIQYMLNCMDATTGELIPKYGKLHDFDELDNALERNDDSFFSGNTPQKDIEHGVLSGIIYFPVEIMIPIYTLLLTALNGEMISNDLSLIKPCQFGSQLISPCITITDEPFFSNKAKIIFDAEGAEVFTKVLVKDGVLMQALNNLKTAAVLSQLPGNCYTNYANYSQEIRWSTVKIDVKDVGNRHYDVRIEQFNDNELHMNVQTGCLSIEVLGYDTAAKKKKRYRFDLTIEQLLSRVIGGVGDYSTNGDIVARDVLLSF